MIANKCQEDEEQIFERNIDDILKMYTYIFKMQIEEGVSNVFIIHLK